MVKKFRNNGAIGALLDEYERANNELIQLISTITDDQLVTIVDRQTTDKDCVSIQSILAHVVRAGFTYVNEIRKHINQPTREKEEWAYSMREPYQKALISMFAYTEELFDQFPSIALEETDASKKILVGWGQKYDVEQLMEHAIVHILRHRRQIERFLLILDHKGNVHNA